MLRSRSSLRPLTASRLISTLIILFLVLATLVLIGISIGSVKIPFDRMADLFAGKGFQSDAERVIVMEVRLPRVVLALVVGAGLSIVGVVFQALLRNPLAEPYILGLSSGGTAGALLAITISANASLITAPLAAFVGCGVVMALVYALAQRHGQLDTYALLLSGIMVGALFNAIVLGAFFLSNQQPRGAFLWLMGNLSGARAESLVFTSPFLLLMALVTIAQAKYYNLIATGEETAAHLGVEVDRFKRRSYILASLMTGLVVSVSGVIGFVGLVIPHICRILFGPDHRVLFPASLLVGGSFLVGADILARTLMAPVEIPVGVITAVVGAPLFVYLLKKT